MTNHPNNPIVRRENLTDPQEKLGVREVNEAAFRRLDEANLIDGLHRERVVLASLVAEHDNRIVGHILFSRMEIETVHGAVPAVALGPMAVHPDFQRRGVGGELIRRGLEEMRKQGESMVIVLGHPTYYPRFGFSPTKASALESPFPAEAFMALELSDGALDGVRGRVRYPVAFGIQF